MDILGGISWDRLVLFFGQPGAAMILGFVAGVVVGSGLYKLITGAYVKSLEVKEENLNGKQADLNGARIELDSKIKAHPEPIAKTLENQRLLNVAKGDRERIDLAIRVYGCKVKWDPDKDPSRVYFEVKIFNGSSYPIRFDGIKEFIAYGNRPVRGDVNFNMKRLSSGCLSPREPATMEIVQLLPDPTIKQLQQDYAGEDFASFSLQALRIMIVDGDGQDRITPQPLAFDGFGSITLQGKLNRSISMP